MSIRRAILFLFGLAAALNGCLPVNPTRPEIGLNSSPTAQATVQRAPSSSPATPTAVLPSSSISPVSSPDATQAKLLPTATPDQSLLILDPIQIRSPGGNSVIVSPVTVQAQLALDRDVNSIRVELRAQDGALLVRKVVAPARPGIPGKDLVESLDFEINPEPIDGWLIIGTDSAPDYPVAVNAAPVRLLPAGMAQITPPTWQAKAIDIQAPAAGVEVSNGLISIAGLTALDADQPLKVQLLGPGGKVIGQSLAEIGGGTADEFKPFSASLAYTVAAQTAARLVVFQELEQTGVILHLASLPVRLNP